MNQPINPVNPINQLNEINDLLLLNIAETETQKRVKKGIFIFISIIFPITEIIFLTLLTIDIIKDVSESEIISPDSIALGLFTFFSLICSWGMISVCYLERKCVINLLFLKIGLIIFIAIFYLGCENFNYYVSYTILFYGIFLTLIILYYIFPKGIIWNNLRIVINNKNKLN